MSNVFISIFTPTYNRGNFLPRLYDSLKKQTCRDFEWIIVDDGSTDETDSVVARITQESPFSIKYIKQKNRGKHAAINKGVSEANGIMFFIVDSDDYLTDRAVETVIAIERTINDKETFCGVSGVRVDTRGNIIGKTFNKKAVDCTALERSKHRISGDKSEVYYTDVLRRYPFPVFDGENFITEYVVWYRMANDGYKIRWTNEPFYVCDYQSTGLSATTGKCSRNFEGFQLTTREYLSYKQIPYIERLKQLIAYSGICLKENKDLKKCAKEIRKTYIEVSFWGVIGLLGYKIRKSIRR